MEQAPIGRLWVEARETVRAAAVDLAEVADQLPVQPEEMEAKARILDRLSQEITEAAGMLRRSASRPMARLGTSPATRRPASGRAAGTSSSARCHPGAAERVEQACGSFPRGVQGEAAPRGGAHRMQRARQPLAARLTLPVMVPVMYVFDPPQEVSIAYTGALVYE